MMRLIHQREEIIVKEIKVPELAESITEGTIAEWLVQPGDQVEKGDPVVELETDKVNVEVNSDYAGVIVELLFEEGDDVNVGDTIAKVDESGEAGAVADSAPAEEAPAAEETKEEAAPQAEETPVASAASQDVVASPAARKLAREKGIDLSEVPTADPLGRVRPEDVEAASRAASAPAPKAQASAEEAGTPEKPIRRERMSRRRQTIAKRLVEAQQTAAMLTTFNEVDMSAVMNLRKERQEQLDRKSTRLNSSHVARSNAVFCTTKKIA